MKIIRRTHRPNAGNVLVLVVITTGLVGITLASYLTLVKSQNLATMRSQAWNTTVPVIEAGIEDALTHLNTHGTNRLDLDGWTKSGDVYSMTRYLPESYYVVTISNWFSPMSTTPIIVSRGYVRMPAQVVSHRTALFASTGETAPAGAYLARGVRVGTRRDSLFAKGMVAKGIIDLNGRNIETDSFDSSDASKSTAGLYDLSKRGDKGSIATNSGLTNSVSVGNATVRGKVSTGPGGSVDIGPNGAVGSSDWHDTHPKGIEPGSVSDDMNVDFPDVMTPSTSGTLSPGGGFVGGVYYDYIVTSGSYRMDYLSLSSDAKMLIAGDATLYVVGNISLSGNAYIEIAPDASLNLYCGGPTASLMGNGIVNHSGYSTNFTYYGLPSNTSLSVNGNGTFTGAIYAPSANFVLNGSGSTMWDFMGASVTKTVTMNGNFKFHYDEALSKVGPTRGYVVTTWNEMSPGEVNAASTYTPISEEIINPTY